MTFDKIAPFMRSVIYSVTSFSTHEEMIGYECRLLYIINGLGELEIGKKPHMLKKGDVVIVNSGVPYRINFPQKKVEFYMVKFDCTQEHIDIDSGTAGDRPEDFKSENILSHIEFEDASQFNDFCILSNMFYSGKLIDQIYAEEKKKLIGWRTRANGLLAEVLVECARAKTGYFEASRLKDVFDYLQASYTEPLNNAEIAAKFGYHPNYLSSLFQRVMGKSMHRYLLSLRIARARELLTTTTLSIGEIAAQCGIENVSNFSAAFKKETGITPSQCRKSAELS